jgi:hypothetical protein
VYAEGEQFAQGIINEPVTSNSTLAFEASPYHPHGEVTALAGTCVSGMQVAVILDLEFERAQSCAQGRLNILSRHAAAG